MRDAENIMFVILTPSKRPFDGTPRVMHFMSSMQTYVSIYSLTRHFPLQKLAVRDGLVDQNSFNDKGMTTLRTSTTSDRSRTWRNSIGKEIERRLMLMTPAMMEGLSDRNIGTTYQSSRLRTIISKTDKMCPIE